MPIRVDSEGYLLDAQGRRLNAQRGNDAESVQERWEQILSDWQETHPDDLDGPDKGTTIMLVERGDSQWTIAEGAGADPVRTYQQLNEQFENPHLIHPGEIVFVDETTQLAVFRNGAYEGQNNIDIFRDQQQAKAEAGASAEELGTDAAQFFASVPDDELMDQVFLSVFESGSDLGDDPEAVALNREAAVRGYLLGFDEEQRPGKLQELRNTYDPAIVFRDRDDTHPDQIIYYSQYNSAIDAAAEGLGLTDSADPPGTQDTNVGPRITTYVAEGDGDNSEEFVAQFQQFSNDIDAGYYHGMDGERHPMFMGGMSIPLGPPGYGFPSFSPVANEWYNLESITFQYMNSTPMPQRYNVLNSIITNPEASSRSRQAAVSAYLKTFATSEQREAERIRLLNSAPNDEVRQDIQIAFDRNTETS